MNIKNHILLWTWCILQTIIGLCILIVCKLRKIIKQKITWKETNVYLIDSKYFSGGSFGKFIFIKYSIHSPYIIRHEYGHAIQSYILGPFYLLLIGLPSLYNNIRARIDSKWKKYYYEKYPEKWANKLGGVDECQK